MHTGTDAAATCQNSCLPRRHLAACPPPPRRPLQDHQVLIELQLVRGRQRGAALTLQFSCSLLELLRKSPAHPERYMEADALESEARERADDIYQHAMQRRCRDPGVQVE